MTWFKVDDAFALHPKAIRAGNAALGLWVRAGSWCGAHLTDGALPKHMVGTLGAQARDARKLVEVGLWCATTDGYLFNDWDHYQPTKAQVQAEREATKERVRKHREQQRNAVTNTVTERVTNSGVTGAPTRPVLSSGLGSQSPNGRSDTSPGEGLDLARIATVIGAGTDQAWANRVVRQILERAPANAVRDPQRYVEAAIRERPGDYRPTPQPPSIRDLCDHGRSGSCRDCAREAS